MADIIKDGGGRGYSAKVSAEGSLNTMAITHPVYAHTSHFGNTFGLTTGVVAISTTGGRLLYIKNTSNISDIHIAKVWFQWNGGTTSRNTTAKIGIYFGDSTPTANQEAVSPGVINRAYNIVPDGEYYKWDGVGDAMTITGGTLGLEGLVGIGSTEADFDGSLILGNNDSFSLSMIGDETGTGAFNVLFYTEATELH